MRRVPKNGHTKPDRPARKKPGHHNTLRRTGDLTHTVMHGPQMRGGLAHTATGYP